MSFNINVVCLDGNLTRDPELRSLDSGTSLCALRIAHNERFKTKAGDWEDRPNYFDVTVWSGQGEWVARNLQKGDRVVVQGRLRWREWEGEHGKRQTVDITADNVIPMSDRQGGGGSRRQEQSSSGEPVPPAEDFQPAAAAASTSDDPIPF